MHQAQEFVAYVTAIVGVGEVEGLDKGLVPGELAKIGVVHRPTFRSGLVRPHEMATGKKERRQHRQPGRKLAAPEDPRPAAGSIEISVGLHYCGTCRSRIRMRCWARAIASAIRAAASPRASMVSSRI